MPQHDFRGAVRESPGAAAQRMQERLDSRCPRQTEGLYREVAPLIRLHLAQASLEILAIEGSFDPRARCRVHGVVLITLGDLRLGRPHAAAHLR